MANEVDPQWLKDRLDALHGDITSLRKEVRGNGKPGLAGRVAEVEGHLYDNAKTRVSGLVSRTKALESEKRRDEWERQEWKWLLRAIALFLLAREVGLAPGEIVRSIFGW